LSAAGEALTAETVAALAAEGDRTARRVWEETGYYLGVGIAHAIGAVNPDTIVLGGGVTGAGEFLLSPARRSASRHTLPHQQSDLRILAAALGEDVGILGAVALTLEAADAPAVDIPVAPG